MPRGGRREGAGRKRTHTPADVGKRVGVWRITAVTAAPYAKTRFACRHVETGAERVMTWRDLQRASNAAPLETPIETLLRLEREVSALLRRHARELVRIRATLALAGGPATPPATS